MISISLPLPSTGLRAPGSPASAAPPGDFALALADMLAVPDAGAEPAAAAIDRQIDAGPGKALPGGDGVDAVDLDSADGDDAEALPPSDVDLAEPAAPPVLPLQTRPSGNVTREFERSPGEERAHARKEAIAALPLPIPVAPPIESLPDTPPAPTKADIAAKAVDDSRPSAIGAVNSLVVASSDITAALPSQQPATDARPSGVSEKRAAASAAGTPEVASAAAPAMPHGVPETVGVDSAVTQSMPGSPAAPTGASGPTAAIEPTAAPAPTDATPPRPTRFLAATAPAEQNFSARADTMTAKRNPGGSDDSLANVALSPSHSPEPRKAAVASAPLRDAGLVPPVAVEGKSVTADAGNGASGDTSGTAARAAAGAVSVERRADHSDTLTSGRVAANAPIKPMMGPADAGTLRRPPSAAERVDVALIDRARPEIKTADHVGRPAPAPIAPHADAPSLSRVDAPNALTPPAPAPSVRSVAPAVTHRDPPLVVTPAAPTHAAPDKGITPAQATPVAPAPRAAPIVPPAAAPVAAIFGGSRPLNPRAPRAGEIGDAPAGLPHTLAATHTASPVQPVAEAQRTPLDMRRDDWTQKLIDRIETIRDAANAADTRIKLMPDALGKIDVSMRKDGDTVHVAFTADAPATRAMLADAQPRLAELAQQRGLRLGQASIDAGTGGDSQQRQAPEPSTPTRPIRAAARDEASTETGRVA